MPGARCSAISTTFATQPINARKIIEVFVGKSSSFHKFTPYLIVFFLKCSIGWTC